MKLSKAVSIDDLAVMARRYLPRIAFDFVDGGIELERCLQRNLDAFARYRLIPHYLRDVSRRSQAVSLFGTTYASPFGVAPTGGAGIWRHGADVMLARAAAKADIPFVLSSGAIGSLKQVVAVAGKNVWFQSYSTKDPTYAHALMDEAQGLGVDTLVVTVDGPVGGRRWRNMRNGFTRPLRVGPRIILDGLRHPAWLIQYYRNGGMPRMESWAGFAPPEATPDDLMALYASQTPSAEQTWDKLARIRDRWPGNLVVKGIVSPADVQKAFATGADGVILSNHGGRNFDPAPSPIEMLPAVLDAVGRDRMVMIDSGFRRGTDVLTALALGAKFVFVGRATLYGVIAGGFEGASHAIGILRSEIDVNMGHLGVNALGELTPDYVMGA